MDLISIIVPIYNTEKFLARCLNSIISQTYSNLEIILVNDGSTDQSLKICEEYREKDSRIKVITQKNQGQGVARNNGLKEAHGEWIAFVDSDDYIEKNMYEILAQNIKKFHADICLSSFAVVIGETVKQGYLGEYQFDKEVYTSKEWLDLFYINDKTNLLSVLVVNKLYSRSIFSDLKFLDIKMCEDEEFATRLYLKNIKIAVVDTPMYFYCKNESSVMNAAYSTRRWDSIFVLYNRIKAFKNNVDDSVYEKALKIFLEIYIENYYQALKLNKSNIEFRKNRYSFVYKEYRKRKKISKDVTRFAIFNLSPLLYKIIVLKLKNI